MPSLFTAMHNSGAALDAFTRVLQVTQNNVANAATPGYARQTQRLSALPFDPASGAMGGVRAGEIESARDDYAEQAVRRETSSLGLAQQNTSSLTALQSLFDITGNSGLPSALNNLLQSFSAWAQSPTDGVARRTVLDRAGDVAGSFRHLASGMSQLRGDIQQQLQQNVDYVNSLTARLAEYNQKAVGGARSDAGLDAQINSTLEELSQYVDFTAARQADGSVTALIGGQIPLVIGSRQFQLAYDLYQSDDPPPVNDMALGSARIRSIPPGYSDGADITASITNGSLGALLDVRNRVLPSVIGDAYQPGELNSLAMDFAQSVNNLLQGGELSDGTPGAPMFTWSQDTPIAAAQTLSVDPTLTPDQLAAVQPGNPPVFNGVPLALSALANPPAVNGVSTPSYVQRYGQMAGRVGSAVQAAQDDLAVQQSAVAQAKDRRQQTSGVSLDQEAVLLMEFQRSYQANSRMITILDQLAQSVIDMLRG